MLNLLVCIFLFCTILLAEQSMFDTSFLFINLAHNFLAYHLWVGKLALSGYQGAWRRVHGVSVA